MYKSDHVENIGAVPGAGPAPGQPRPAVSLLRAHPSALCLPPRIPSSERLSRRERAADRCSRDCSPAALDGDCCSLRTRSPPAGSTGVGGPARKVPGGREGWDRPHEHGRGVWRSVPGRWAGEAWAEGRAGRRVVRGREGPAGPRCRWIQCQQRPLLCVLCSVLFCSP